jgi:hypothetical protein
VSETTNDAIVMCCSIPVLKTILWCAIKAP